jgi:hypothetical protein
MSFSENRLGDTFIREVRLPYITADEHMAGGIHCCPNFFISLPDQRLYLVKNMCARARAFVYTHTRARAHTHTPTHPPPNAYRLYMNHRCYKITLRVKHFHTNQERCEVLTGYLSLGRRPGGDWASTCHWTKLFTLFLSNGN